MLDCLVVQSPLLLCVYRVICTQRDSSSVPGVSELAKSVIYVPHPLHDRLRGFPLNIIDSVRRQSKCSTVSVGFFVVM